MVDEGAKVTSIDELARFRAGVVKALEELRLAISEADTEVGRVRGWLERDQTLYWQSQIRKAQENVALTKSALYRKQMVTSSKDQKPSVVDEKKAFEKAQARLAHCQQKQAATKKWAIELTREEILFKAGMAPMSTVVERDLPQAVILLGRMIEHLEAYTRIQTPDLARALGEKKEELIADMKRTGEEGPGSGSDAEPESKPEASAESGGDAPTPGADDGAARSAKRKLR